MKAFSIIALISLQLYLNACSEKESEHEKIKNQLLAEGFGTSIPSTEKKKTYTTSFSKIHFKEIS